MAIDLYFVFGIFGNIFGIALFVVPSITFISVVKRGSTEEYSGIPYVTALFNCLVYTWYGLPLVSSNNLLVSSVNGCGSVLEILYVSLYLAYAPSKYRMKILRLFIGVLVLFAAIVAVSVLGFHGTGRELFVGIIGVAVSVAIVCCSLVNNEIGGPDKKCGVYALLPFTECISMRFHLVYLWHFGQRCICGSSKWIGGIAWCSTNFTLLCLQELQLQLESSRLRKASGCMKYYRGQANPTN